MRHRVDITGRIQGVGFRPYVANLARRFALSGWVRNTGNGVTLEWQGGNVDAATFALPRQPPEGAVIERVAVTELDDIAEELEFSVLNADTTQIDVCIGSDVAVCESCLRDLFDPQSRFYLYPFISCSRCGPRYTAVERLPYERGATSLAPFAMCGRCEQDYLEPNNRRYYAESIACKACGPRYDVDVDAIVERVRKGDVVALKGVGGFHLVCDAHNDVAVLRLRQRKHRPEQPFAIMMANVMSARQQFKITEIEAGYLQGVSRPVVILKQKESTLSTNVNPRLDAVGVMLPYAPIHYLLMWALAGKPELNGAWEALATDTALVMTSANQHGNPLVIDDAEAHRILPDLADMVVGHNRNIIRRCDDSVIRLHERAPVFIRRSRGYVPQPILLPRAVPPMLAMGGHLKNTICVTAGRKAYLSAHVGDLSNRETVQFADENVTAFLELLNIRPELVVHDLHPDYWGSQKAETFGLPTRAIQHHWAHLAAVAAEWQVTEPYLGVALDGLGFGVDGSWWGGELCWVDRGRFERLAGLYPLRMPGGEQAARQPKRMALSALYAINGADALCQSFAERHQLVPLLGFMESEVLSPITSSCGRWFDAAAGLLDLCDRASYEAQAAMLLESKCRQLIDCRDFTIADDGTLDLRPVVTKLLDDDVEGGAMRFHGSLVSGIVEWVHRYAKKIGTRRIILGGGCLQNYFVSVGVTTRLSALGYRVHRPAAAPANDGGLSLGQIWAAATQISANQV